MITNITQNNSKSSHNTGISQISHDSKREAIETDTQDLIFCLCNALKKRLYLAAEVWTEEIQENIAKLKKIKKEEGYY